MNSAEGMDADDETNTDDTFRILVATDNHLGYAEKDPIRCEDSFITFEEILALAPEHNVDFILLGGDLFHENKPSRYSMCKCIKLLRQYTLGDKPVEFEVLHDDHSKALDRPANFLDPNINVSYPVFSIHGNHDDPSGQGSMCTLDLLSEMGLVNHFGRCDNMERVEMKPVLLQKGATKLALYGLGSVRDERLHRIFREDRVTMVRPEEDTDAWFNMLVFHQNRYKHSQTSYIPQSFLDDFLDLVIWGHEHECIVTPTSSDSKGFFISQPGSSVATSLSIGEATKKYVGILEVHKQHFKMNEIELKTVRPFCFKEIALHETSLNLTGPKVEAKVMEYCEAVVESLIKKSRKQLSGHENQPEIPLIRLRVEIQKDDQQFSINRFGQKFQNRVANPKDIIMFHRKRSSDDNKHRDAKGDIISNLKVAEQDLAHFSAVDIVREHFEVMEEKNRLKLLTETGLGRAVKEFVDKEEKEAIEELVNHQDKRTQQFLNERPVTIENIEAEIERFKQERRKKKKEEDEDVNEAMRQAKLKRLQKGEEGSDEAPNDMEVESDSDLNASTSSSRTGRGARGSRARGRGRGANAVVEPSNLVKGSKGRGSRGRGAKGSQAKASVNTVCCAFEKMRASGSRISGQSASASRLAKNDDAVIISDSDDEVMPSPKRRKTNAKTVPQKSFRFFEVDSEEDPF